MEYNNPSQLVKHLNFGKDADDKIMSGVEKLANAVKSTLGASGKCVIYEDALGKPVITKDGVTVADSVVLLDPVENIGATLIKEAAKNTVKEAGDGTTTAIVLAESLLNELKSNKNLDTTRNIKNGIESGYKKVVEYLSKHSKAVSGSQLTNVSSISCNNDSELGSIIASAYEKVGKDGVVLMEESETGETFTDFVDGTQLECGLTSPYFVTDNDKQKCELEKPLILIVSSKIPSVRKIQKILEHVIKNSRSLLIVAEVEQQVKSALLMNKVKGNIKVNIINPPGFGPTKRDTIDDLAFLTGAKVMNEELGDDLDLIEPSCLGEAALAVTDDKQTVLTTYDLGKEFKDRIDNVKKKIKKEDNTYLKKRLEQRLAMLNGSVGIIKVGADSKVELKEKKDRVEDAIYAVKAALKEGIVAGGGIALLNAAKEIENTGNIGEKILLEAIKAPFTTIMANAGIENYEIPTSKGIGYDVTTGELVDMLVSGIVDPALVTKTALKNAVSVATTIFSADCVINNIRVGNESS